MTSAVRRKPSAPSRLRLPLESPLLTRAEERDLFRRRKSLADRAAGLRRRRELGEASPAVLERIEALEEEATEIRNRILQSNLRLIVSVASGFAGGQWPLDELVSECFAPVLRAIELFDVDSGNSFSTYATHAARNAIGRAMGRRARQSMRVATADAGALACVPSRDDVDRERQAAAARTLASRALARLSERERLVVSARFGLGRFPREHTFGEIGALLGVSKERARVLGHQAIETLRGEVRDGEYDYDA